MGRELIKTFGHAGIYTIGIVLNRAVSFVMLPVYTRCLSPSDYGTLELLEMTVDIVTTMAALGIHQGFFRFYNQCGTAADRKELTSTIYLLVIGLFSFFTIAGMAAGPSISLLVFGSKDYSQYVMISFLNMLLQFLVVMSLLYLRVQYKSMLFVGLSIIKVAIQVSLNIAFVVYLKMGILGVLYSTMISSLLLGIGMTSYTFANVGFHFSKPKAQELIKFGLPFVASSYGAFILTFSDRYFLNYYANLAEVGVYSLAYKFGFLLMTFPVSPLNNIWMAQRFELVTKDGYERIFNRYIKWFIIITVATALFLAMSIRDVLKIMSAPAFWDAYKIVPIIVLAYFMQACTDIFNFGIHYSGKTKHIAYGTTLAAIFIIALSFVLIPRYGMYGAAWATLIAFVVRLFYFYYASQKLFRINYELSKPIATLFIGILIYVLYWNMLHFDLLSSIYRSSVVTLLFLLSFSGLLVFFNIINAEEKRLLINSFKSPLRALAEIKNQFAS